MLWNNNKQNNKLSPRTPSCTRFWCTTPIWLVWVMICTCVENNTHGEQQSNSTQHAIGVRWLRCAQSIFVTTRAGSTFRKESEESNRNSANSAVLWSAHAAAVTNVYLSFTKSAFAKFSIWIKRWPNYSVFTNRRCFIVARSATHTIFCKPYECWTAAASRLTHHVPQAASFNSCIGHPRHSLDLTYMESKQWRQYRLEALCTRSANNNCTPRDRVTWRSYGMRAPQALSAVVLLVGAFQLVLPVEAAAWIFPAVAIMMIIDTWCEIATG